MNVEKLSKALRAYADAKTTYNEALAKLRSVQGEVESAEKAKERAIDAVLEVGTQITR